VLQRHRIRLHAKEEIATWNEAPLTSVELALAEITDWGQAEDWSDWADATG
jgi:hypothetical protein